MEKPYLPRYGWKTITREERLFCAHLYFILQDPKRLKEFVKILNRVQKIVSQTDDIEVAYEVCFYRDLLLAYGEPVKSFNKLKKEHFRKFINIKSPSCKLETALSQPNNLLIKRTFDLCLFTKNSIVIIEAKCNERISRDQYHEFLLDKEFINLVYNKSSITKNPPDVKLIILVSSKYRNSPSFTVKSGVGTEIEKDRKSEHPYKTDAIITWKELYNGMEVNEESRYMLKRADDIYQENKGKRILQCGNNDFDSSI